MKQFLLVISVMTIVNCGTVEFKRTVQDENIFYSSQLPEISIKINPDFKYAKDFHRTEVQPTTHYKIDRYLFVHENASAPSTIQIEFQKLTRDIYEFNKTVFANMPNAYETGSLKIRDIGYQYCVYVTKWDSDWAINYAIGRRVGLRNQARFFVICSEKVFDDWSDINDITKEQKDRLRGFIEKSKNDFTILK